MFRRNYSAKASSTVIVSSRWIVIKGTVSSPRDPLLRRQRSGPLRLIKQERIFEDGGVVVLSLHRGHKCQGEEQEEPHDDGVDETVELRQLEVHVGGARLFNANFAIRRSLC